MKEAEQGVYVELGLSKLRGVRTRGRPDPADRAATRWPHFTAPRPRAPKP